MLDAMLTLLRAEAPLMPTCRLDFRRLLDAMLATMFRAKDHSSTIDISF